MSKAAYIALHTQRGHTERAQQGSAKWQEVRVPIQVEVEAMLVHDLWDIGPPHPRSQPELWGTKLGLVMPSSMFHHEMVVEPGRLVG